MYDVVYVMFFFRLGEFRKSDIKGNKYQLHCHCKGKTYTFSGLLEGIKKYQEELEHYAKQQHICQLGVLFSYFLFYLGNLKMIRLIQ